MPWQQLRRWLVLPKIPPGCPHVCAVLSIHGDFTHSMAHWYLPKGSMAIPMTCGKSLALVNAQQQIVSELAVSLRWGENPGSKQWFSWLTLEAPPPTQVRGSFCSHTPPFPVSSLPRHTHTMKKEMLFLLFLQRRPSDILAISERQYPQQGEV